MLSTSEINTAIRVQILNEAVCILYNANTLEKGMNPTIVIPVIGK